MYCNITLRRIRATIAAVEKQLSITYSKCVSVDFRTQQCWISVSTNFMKIRPMGAELFDADGQTDRQT